MRATPSDGVVTGHSGQSDAIHSPELWRRVMVRLLSPVVGSIELAWTVSSWVRHLRLELAC